MKTHRNHTFGFTLVEMAIVLVIVGLLLGGMLMPLSAQMDQRRASETQKALDEITQALIGFAVSHTATDGKPYLPCPDTTNDGQEDRTDTACTNQEGRLPWADLGVADTDSWGYRYRYRVSPVFSNNATGFTLSSTGGITVNNAATGGNIVATSIPTTILSHGKNGIGAFNQAGGTNPTTGAGANELANTDSNTTFVSRTPSGMGATGGEFDDLVAWVSPNTLFNRMVTAGKLP